MIRKLITSVFAALFLSMLVAHHAYATDPPTIEVTPAHVQIHLTPGIIKHQTVTVTNKSDQEISIRIYTESYKQNSSSNSSQIIRWLTFEQDTHTILANQTIKVNYDIHVPLDVAYGDQLATIYIEKTNFGASNQTGAITVPRVGSVLKATVSGDTRDGITISDLQLPSYILINQSSLIASGKVSNIGNTDLDTFFHLEVKNLFGQTLYNKESSTIVESGTEHTITQEWKEMPIIGLFKVHYSVKTFGKQEELSRLIIAMPIWVIIAITVAILAAAMLIAHHIIHRRKFIRYR